MLYEDEEEERWDNTAPTWSRKRKEKEEGLGPKVLTRKWDEDEEKTNWILDWRAGGRELPSLTNQIPYCLCEFGQCPNTNAF
jgi:hypothetical protein